MYYFLTKTLLFLLCVLRAEAFHQSPRPAVVPRTTLVPATAHTWKLPQDNRMGPVTTICSAKKPSANNDLDENEDTGVVSSVMDWIQAKPGNLVIAPFLFLFGLDLLANIFFLSKRTFEYFAFGKAPSTEVWFTNNFFL